MEKGKTRLIIREGIKRRESAGEIKLMDPVTEDEIKYRIEEAINAILAGTEYERLGKNPPVFGVEKDTV